MRLAKRLCKCQPIEQKGLKGNNAARLRKLQFNITSKLAFEVTFGKEVEKNMKLSS